MAKLTRRVLRAWGWITALLLTAAAALLIAQTVMIYHAGNAPENWTAAGVRMQPMYSRAIVAERLGVIAVPLWACVAAAAAGLVLRAGLGEEPRRPVASARVSAPPCVRPRGRTATRAILLAASAALIIHGVLNGGLWDVLVKAVNICTECIGLG